MANKIICCSFDKESLGGFITICNGVNFSKPEHYSKTIAVTREAFIAACKDRMLFNDILGIDIRDGWQNSLGAAIACYQTMKEEFDPSIALKTSSELDVKLRGEEAVTADIETLEKANEIIGVEVEKAKEKKKTTKKKTTKKEVKDDEPTVERPDNVSENAGSEENNGVSVDGTGTECNE